MNKDELIKLGLSQEQAEAVLNLYKPATDAFAKLEVAKSELEQTRATIAERDRQLEALKDASTESRSLQKQIAQLQAQNVEVEQKYKAELLSSRKAYAVRQALLEADQKPQNIKIVMSQLDLDKVFIDDDGNLTGLQEQQMRLVHDAPYLFKLDRQQSKPQNGFTIHGAGVRNIEPPQPAQNHLSKPAVASADFGRQLAEITLKSHGLKIQE